MSRVERLRCIELAVQLNVIPDRVVALAGELMKFVERGALSQGVELKPGDVTILKP